MRSHWEKWIKGRAVCS